MYQRFKIHENGLVTIRRLFGPERRLLLNDIRFVEVHGKSIVPPLVISVFLVALQVVLATLVRLKASLWFLAVDSPLPILYVLTMVCILHVLIRARYVTLKIAVDSSGKLLNLHFVSRTTGGRFASEIETLIKNQ
ncbi:hypothetical protein KEJ39_05100 [Candidatus Bathyarchaeota archaeon]|nr:hypothetical protein [Candidatus Bathyarchaeota archaeon]